MNGIELGGVSGGEQCERHAMLRDGTEVLCMKSYGHDTIYRPGDPRRQHYDVGEEIGWYPEEEDELISS
jgi:hypothetical protein